MPFSADRVRKYRESRDMSREALAESIGRSYPSVVLYETGRVTPPLSVIEDIAQALNVTTADLLDEAA